MKTVAILGTRGYPSYYGGFETAVRRLSPFLADAGWKVTVYGRSGALKEGDESRDPRVESVVTKGIESRSLSTISYGFTSALSVVRRKPDVALVMNVANGFWLPMLRAARVPTLVNVDGIEWEREKWSTLGKRVFLQGARATAKYATEIVCDSTSIRDRWSRDFGREGLFIPYGGETPKRILPVEEGLEHGQYALMVARFVPENTVPEFIEAAVEIAKTRDVVIVGSSGYGGELDERVGRLAADSPRVRWLGHVSDDDRLHSLWQHAGAYFHGHSVGGTNPALVQAMACGAPTVARDTVFNREVLGDNGVFVRPEASEIAREVLSLLDDGARQEQYRHGALARAASDYSWDGVNGLYEAALRKLARV